MLPAGMQAEKVQRVRVTAEEALSAATTDAQKLKLTCDVTVLRLLADQPPDRVGIVRTLKLGTTHSSASHVAPMYWISARLVPTRPPPCSGGVPLWPCGF
eukprot:1689565-Prymnesium_polylepis.1